MTNLMVLNIKKKLMLASYIAKMIANDFRLIIYINLKIM